MFSDRIKVEYDVYTTSYKALKALNNLPDTIALDFETRSQWSNAEIREAKDLLKTDELSHEDRILCKLVANSSGLSFPAITKITHVNIAWAKDKALVIVVSSPKMEQVILGWIVNTNRHFIFWNHGFDGKIIYQKTGKFVQSYDDGQLLAKCYLNHCDNWKAKVGLKDLMGEYYQKEWCLIDSYSDEDLKKESFLRYSAIDAAATFYGWEILQTMGESNE